MRRYTTYGSVRGQGKTHETPTQAERSRLNDCRQCGAQGGFSDRRVMAVLPDGTLDELTEEEYAEACEGTP